MTDLHSSSSKTLPSDSHSWRAFLEGLQRFAGAIASLRGVRRYAASMIAGAFAAAALAPLYMVPGLVVSFAVLVWLLDGTDNRPRGLLSAGLIGWSFGFGYFLAGLYWIGFAFLVQAEQFAWLIPIVAVLLPGGLALFTAAATASARLVWSDGPSRILFLAVAWAVFEWLRGTILTGFPWNLVGYAWGGVLPLLQTTSVIGSYGLSLLTVLGATSAALLVAFPATKSVKNRKLGKQVFLPVLMLGCFAILFALGTFRLAANPTQWIKDVNLRLVNANIDQRDKFDRTKSREVFEKYLRLTETAGANDITHFIWPESATLFPMSRELSSLHEISQTIGQGRFLLTGSPRIVNAPELQPYPYRFFNSMHVIDGNARILQTYDKSHLVPFGEYLPYRQVMNAIGLRHLTAARGDLSPGTGLRTLSAPALPEFGPLICYEAIFPGHVTDPLRRPGFLLSLTDDSWFGQASGPHQHFDQARIRAIEEGLPMVRAANMGFSAIIDASGRIIRVLGMNGPGIVDGPLPEAQKPTIYASWGDTLFWLLCLSLLGGGIALNHYRSVLLLTDDQAE